MSSFPMWQFTDHELEDYLDQTKGVILNAMVSDGTLEKDAGEAWAREHTVIIRKKGFFRTISELWWNTKTEKGSTYILIVKGVPCVAFDDPEQADSETPLDPSEETE